MSPYPYTILSSAISIDGYLNDTGKKRLLLSHKDDFARVDKVRASCDGILVGANTVRVDNPGLRIRSQSLIQQRIDAQLPQYPARITITSTDNLPATHAFFSDSDNAILVYAPSTVANKLEKSLSNTSAQVIPMGKTSVELPALLMDLKERGIEKLLIEGGERIATAFLTAGLINEFHLAMAPFFVGEPGAPRLVNSGIFPHDKNNRMHLHDTRIVGDMAVLTYKLQTLHAESDF